MVCAQGIVISEDTKIVFTGQVMLNIFDGNLKNSGDIINANETLIFTGSENGNIAAESKTNIYRIDNANVSGMQLSGSHDLGIINNLKLTASGMQSDSNRLIVFHGAAITGFDSTRYVKNAITKIGNEAFTFPVGSAQRFAPVSISAPIVEDDAFTVQYFYADPGLNYDAELLGFGIDSISKCEYWEIDREFGNSAVEITLYWNNQHCLPGDMSELSVLRWNGWMWVNEWGYISGNAMQGSITTGTIDQFSPFTLGTSTEVLSATISEDTSWYMISSPAAIIQYGSLLSNFVTQGYPGSTYPSLQPNLLWFDETDTLTTLMSWRTPQSTSDTIAHGRGHYFFVFGNILQDTLYNQILPADITVNLSDVFNGSDFTYHDATFPVTFTPRTGSDNPVTAEGILIETNLADEGWNLLGNPGASTLDWGAVSGWTKNNLDASIYIWNAASKTFQYFNGITGTHDGKIPPFQAFWVRANNLNPELSFTDAVYISGGTFQKPEKPDDERDFSNLHLHMSLYSENLTTEAVISFTQEGKIGEDFRDAFRLESLAGSHVDLFTLSSPTDNFPLAINHLPLNSEDYFNIPLFVDHKIHSRSVSSALMLQWDLPRDWPSDWSIILHDHVRKKAISMKQIDKYPFYYSPEKSGDSSVDRSPENRTRLFNPVNFRQKGKDDKPPFSIIIQKGVSDEQVEYLPSVPVLMPVYPNPFSEFTNIRFNLPQGQQVQLVISDINGRNIQTLYKGELPGGLHKMEWQNPGLAPGVYFLTLYTENGMDVKKIQLLRA